LVQRRRNGTGRRRRERSRRIHGREVAGHVVGNIVEEREENNTSTNVQQVAASRTRRRNVQHSSPSNKYVGRVEGRHKTTGTSREQPSSPPPILPNNGIEWPAAKQWRQK
jgi:hypothetical protein